MTKIRLIVLLIFFLPCIIVGMENETLNTAPTKKSDDSKGDKMAIRFLVHEYDIDPKTLTLSTNNLRKKPKKKSSKRSENCYEKNSKKISKKIRIFPEEQNDIIRHIVNFLKNNNNECKCTFCTPSRKMLSTSIRAHFISFHWVPFSCSACNQDLNISYPSQVKAKYFTTCEKSDTSFHIPVKRADLLFRLNQIKQQIQPSTT